MNLKTLYKEVRKKLKGSLAIAIENGMSVEDGVDVMGNVNFGSEPYLIKLCARCGIANGVIFITHDGGTRAFRNRWPEYADVVKYGRIEIGEESVIGARSIILPGVKIGRNCVVGAGSVVTRDVPDESVVYGVPAKRVCSIREYAEKCKSQMPEDFNLDEYRRDKKEYLMKHLPGMETPEKFNN